MERKSLNADRAYFDEISPGIRYLIGSMREQSTEPDDYIVFVIKDKNDSRITVCPREGWISEMNLLAVDHPHFKPVIDRVGSSPGHPSARWVVFSRDGGSSFAVCSIIAVDVSKSTGDI